MRVAKLGSLATDCSDGSSVDEGLLARAEDVTPRPDLQLNFCCRRRRDDIHSDDARTDETTREEQLGRYPLEDAPPDHDPSARIASVDSPTVHYSVRCPALVGHGHFRSTSRRFASCLYGDVDGLVCQGRRIFEGSNVQASPRRRQSQVLLSSSVPSLSWSSRFSAGISWLSTQDTTYVLV